MGWMLLGERPGRELTFGQVGKPWKPRGGSPTEPVIRAEFAAFDQPGFAKLVESTRVDPYGERSSIVTMETRVRGTDPDSRRTLTTQGLFFSGTALVTFFIFLGAPYVERLRGNQSLSAA